MSSIHEKGEVTNEVMVASEAGPLQEHTKELESPIISATGQPPPSAVPLQSHPDNNHHQDEKSNKFPSDWNFPMSTQKALNSIQWRNFGLLERQTDEPSQIQVLKSLSKEYWIAFALCFCISFADSLDLLTMSYGIQKIARYYHTSNGYMSQAITYSLLQRTLAGLSFAMFAGDIEGGHGHTVFANKHLKWFIVVDMVALGSLQIAATYVTSSDLFLVVRVLFGLGTGGLWSTNAIELIRFCPKRARSFLFASFQCSTAFASILAAGLNTSFGISDQANSWRKMFQVSAGILYFCAVLRFFIPAQMTNFDPVSPEVLQRYLDERCEMAQFTWKQRVKHAMKNNIQRPWRHYRKMMKTHRGLVRYFALLMFIASWFAFSINLNYITFLIFGKDVSNESASVIVIIIKSVSIVGTLLSGLLCQIYGPKPVALIFGVIAMALTPAAFLPFSNWALALGGSFFNFFSDGFIATLPILLNKYTPARYSIMIPILASQFGGFLSSPSAQVVTILGDALHFTRDGKSIQAYQYILLVVSLITIFSCVVLIYFGPKEDGEQSQPSQDDQSNPDQNTSPISGNNDNQIETSQSSDDTGVQT